MPSPKFTIIEYAGPIYYQANGEKLQIKTTIGSAIICNGKIAAHSAEGPRKELHLQNLTWMRAKLFA